MYAYHGAVGHVIASSLAHPIMFITTNTDALLATLHHNCSLCITSILLCDHDAEHEAPHVDYKPVPVSHCIEYVSSMEVALGIIAPEYPLMDIPPQLGTYLSPHTVSYQPACLIIGDTVCLATLTCIYENCLRIRSLRIPCPEAYSYPGVNV